MGPPPGLRPRAPASTVTVIRALMTLPRTLGGLAAQVARRSSPASTRFATADDALAAASRASTLPSAARSSVLPRLS